MNKKKDSKRSKETSTVKQFVEYLFDDSIAHTEEEIIGRILIRNMAKWPQEWWGSDSANNERRDN